MMRVIMVVMVVLLATTIGASADYSTQILLARDPIFLSRVEYAIVLTALNVRAEGSTNATCFSSLTPTQCHAARSVWAGLVLGNPIGYATLMAPGFVTQPTVAASAVCTTTMGVTTCTTTATDVQLQSISDALWNDYSVQ